MLARSGNLLALLTLTTVCGLLVTRAQAADSTPKPQDKAPAAQSEPAPQAAAKPGSLSYEARADIYMARKQYADAIDYFRRALREPGQASPAVLWNKIGIAYQFEGSFQAARKAYKRAIHYKKDYAEPWNNLGTTYFLLNKAGKSVGYYKHAITIAPGSASFHMNLGASYSKLKKFDLAVQEYRTALTLDPQILTEHAPVAPALEARGDDIEFYYYVAKVFAALGRPEESLRYLRRALEDGFKDYKRLDADPDFAKLKDYPPYVELRKHPPVAISE